MVDDAPSALPVELVRTFIGHLPQGAAVFDPQTGQTIYANPALQRLLDLSAPDAPLPPRIVLQATRAAGESSAPAPETELPFRVSVFPLEACPQATLVQEAISPCPIVSAVERSLPIGLAWIDRRTDQLTFINRAFWAAWRLAPDRQPDRGAKLRATCRGYVLDPEAFDVAWPADTDGPQRFADIALTDGRNLRIATFDRAPDDRWLLVQDVSTPSSPPIEDRGDELRARESQRLESLAVLAGGIAHDFNNLLLVILTNAEMLAESTPLGPSAQTALADIRLAAERASELSAKMLAYSGHGQMVSQPTEVHRVVEAVVNEARAEHPTPTIALAVTTERPKVNGDPDQLRQLVKAVLLNAIESPGTRAIDVGIDVAVWTPDALGRLYLGDQLVSGPYVTILVRDDGEGIDRTVLPRVFDPFFSTRGPSRGLGLAAAAGIARGHGGTIDIKSDRGRGADVRIVLPLLQAARRPTSSPGVPRARDPEGTILLVDDESLVRRSARQALEQAGFHVVEAENGEQALELFARQPERFDLVIMDISMPGASGDVVAKQMRALTETPVPLILSSGYRPRVDLEAEGIADHFLQKPYRRTELIQSARQLLDG